MGVSPMATKYGTSEMILASRLAELAARNASKYPGVHAEAIVGSIIEEYNEIMQSKLFQQVGDFVLTRWLAAQDHNSLLEAYRAANALPNSVLMDPSIPHKLAAPVLIDTGIG